MPRVTELPPSVAPLGNHDTLRSASRCDDPSTQDRAAPSSGLSGAAAPNNGNRQPSNVATGVAQVPEPSPAGSVALPTVVTDTAGGTFTRTVCNAYLVS